MEEVYKCWNCGKPVKRLYEPTDRVFCLECEKKVREEHAKLVKEYSALKLRVMYENALRTMEKSNTYMYEYEESAKNIYNAIINDKLNFDSSYEIIASIVLDEYGYEYERYKKILNYEVDFYIPEFKACLEIDGDRHETRTDYDSKRDIAIRKELGADWEVIRIGTKYLEQRPSMLPEAIERLKAEKVRLRKKNNGILPEYYSKREMAQYKDALEYRTKYVIK